MNVVIIIMPTTDKINVEITRTSYDKINYIKIWYDVFFKTHSNKKKVIDYIVNEFINLKELDYKELEEVKEDKSYNILKNYRGDVNLDHTVKEYLQAIKEHMNEKNINEVLKTIALQFIESNPEINKILLRNKLIKQKVAFNDMIIQNRKQNNLM